MTSAKLLVVDTREGLRHIPRESLVDVLQRGDLVVANDAATLPASLHGTHVASGQQVEVRLAGRNALSSVVDFSAVVFGAGDFHTRTEDRPLPPPLAIDDRLELGPLSATVTGLIGHPRLVALHFDGTADEIWAGIARHGKPIQYAHVPAPLVLWDVWTPIASPPVAFEPPSAGFALDWHTIAAMRARGIGFATITHAAGISSTGDPELDKRLPFDEPYRGSAFHSQSDRRHPFDRREDRGNRNDCRARARARRLSRWRGACRSRLPPLNGSAAAHGVELSMRFSRASTSPGRVTTSYCERSPTM